MNKRGSFIKALSLVVCLIFVVSGFVSCGGGGGGDSMSSTEQAAVTVSAAQAAIQLSGAVGSSAQIAEESIPAGYAPGKGTSRGTDNIAKIDPRLKDMVDKMTAQLRQPVVQNTLSKARSFKTISSAPLSAYTDTNCYDIISNNVSTTATGTTSVLTVTFDDCRSSNPFPQTYENLSGSITATHTVDTAVGTYESTQVNATLTNTSYLNSNFTGTLETAVLSGLFTSQTSSLSTSQTGTNMANGDFTVTTSTSHPTQPDMKYQFTFSNAKDIWSVTSSSGNPTETHTGNGAYVLGITRNASTAPETITLTVGLKDMQAKEFTFSNSDEDLWLNGTVSISWSPDISQRGCLSGTYLFTTAAGTPIRTLANNPSCPSSGTVQVNNAIFKFGSPAFPQVTVTLIGGPSQTFPDCDLGGGTCM